MKLHLVDTMSDLVAAWSSGFREHPEVHVIEGELLAVARNTVVSPANSVGIMDGGIDRDYLAFFGEKLQRTVLDAVSRRPEGHLPVGASLVVLTDHPAVPYLIVAPTMLEPEPITDVQVCYRAMRAVLRAAARNGESIVDVYCPGLGTGVGQVDPRLAADQMALAYRDWKNQLGCS